MTRISLAPRVAAGGSRSPAADRADILVADFEGDTYGDGWKTTGTAFGKGPAKGTLPNQMPVSGLSRQGARQQLPRRRRQHRHADLARVQDRAQVHQLPDRRREAREDVRQPARRRKGRPHRDRPERQARRQRTPRLAHLGRGRVRGQGAAIEIVDDEKGGWGHINVDHIVQSDAKKQAEPVRAASSRDRQAVPAPAGEERREPRMTARRSSPSAWRDGRPRVRHRTGRRASRTSGCSPMSPRSRGKTLVVEDDAAGRLEGARRAEARPTTCRTRRSSTARSTARCSTSPAASGG